MAKPEQMDAMWTRPPVLFAGLIAANAAAWIWAWMAFSDQPALLGSALLTWIFGLRHAVDADHITAIDNVVRKLMGQGRRPHLAGFFFSLGHSSIVILAALAAAASTALLRTQWAWFRTIGAVIGTSVSAAFLLLIALVNLAIPRGAWRDFRRASPGGATVLDQPMGGGFLAHLFRPLFNMVTRAWHMYPLGVLFGLGFDTATEVGLLSLAATQAAGGMSPWRTLVFPALFTAAMALVDTADSVLMVGAYGWANVQPLRKLWYNLTMTVVSVLVALLIGGVEALALPGDQLGLEGGIWPVVSGLNGDLAYFGFAVVAIFLLTWGLSIGVFRWLGYDRLAGAGSN